MYICTSERYLNKLMLWTYIRFCLFQIYFRDLSNVEKYISCVLTVNRKSILLILTCMINSHVGLKTLNFLVKASHSES